MAEGLAEGHREEFHRGAEDHRVLGDDPFLAAVIKQQPAQLRGQSLEAIATRVCEALEVPVNELAQAGRSGRAAEARGDCAPVPTVTAPSPPPCRPSQNGELTL